MVAASSAGALRANKGGCRAKHGLHRATLPPTSTFVENQRRRRLALLDRHSTMTVVRYSEAARPCRRSIEITLQRSFATDVQGHAMRTAAKQLRVPQFQRDHVETVLLEELYKRGLIAIHDH